MGKTHEALERAEKEHGESLLEPTTEPRKSSFSPPTPVSDNGAMEWYQNLKTNLLNRHPAGSIKTILFSGTTHGDGASTTAINFATTLAKNCKLKVLLVDVNLRTPCLHEVCKIDHSPGLSDLLNDECDMESRIKKIGPGEFYVLPCGGNNSRPANLLESSHFDNFLKTMREKYDFVILDAPPVPSFSDSCVICGKVDGVVLVLGSGKTRRQVALKAKKELEEAGGKVVGLVLNRRKFYIPEWIYQRL